MLENFRANVLNFGLESENFRQFKTLLSESFEGNCARAPRLTAVWAQAGPASSRQVKIMGGET